LFLDYSFLTVTSGKHCKEFLLLRLKTIFAMCPVRGAYIMRLKTSGVLPSRWEFLSGGK
jgi:hypothetical protein